MKQPAEVVTIGGGIQGISLACRLAKKGLNDVLIVETNTLGSGSSGRWAAVIGHALQSETGMLLTQISLRAFPRFRDELGADPGYEPIGYPVLGDSQCTPRLHQDSILHQRLGREAHLVDRDIAAGRP